MQKMKAIALQTSYPQRPSQPIAAAATSCARCFLCRCGAFLVILVLLLPSSALAGKGVPNSPPEHDNWQVELASHENGPSMFLAIDKNKQQLFLLEQRSPLSLAGQFQCSTGEIPGDKLVEGDLKTPEGVYFVQRRLSSGLDYELYGDLAFTLNYPNPIDRIKGKTGSGIWIHGRGYDLIPRETKGCVALNNPDLHNLDPKLVRGTPVLIAGDVSWSEQLNDADVPRQLAQKVKEWARTWETKDESHFAFYHPALFSKSGKHSFTAFREHKENLFRNLPWIQVRLHELRIMAGPDYWITWFGQFYRSPSFSSEGVKRLYWMRDESGELRIVGMEWESIKLGLDERYLAALGGSALRFIEAWRAAWEKADLDAYMTYYDKQASQGGRRGADSIQEHKIRLWEEKPPQLVGIDDLEISLHPKGVKVSFVQEYTARGFRDKGLKTLYLQPDGDSWRIVDEDWEAI